MFSAVISGLALGLVSSLHCVGMCGPIALALPVQHRRGGARVAGLLLYHTGRSITYMLLGAVIYLAGRGFLIAGMQQVLSIATGALLLVWALLYFFKWPGARNGGFLLTAQLQTAMMRLMQRDGAAGLFLLGMLNGLLPCGMVYIALAASLLLNSFSHTMAYMLSFGLATIPAMLALSLLSATLPMRLRLGFKKLYPYMMVAVALLLILRGLNLGIPYLSPQLVKEADTAALPCH